MQSCATNADFYKLVGDVFRRQARWSKVRKERNHAKAERKLSDETKKGGGSAGGGRRSNAAGRSARFLHMVDAVVRVVAHVQTRGRIRSQPGRKSQ
jgi:hypothetical protein